jgi:hypothetical protein
MLLIINQYLFYLFVYIFHFIPCTCFYDSENGLTCHAVLSNGSATFAVHHWFDWSLFHQNKKYKAVSILAYLPHFDTVARKNGKCSHVSRNRMEHLHKEI